MFAQHSFVAVVALVSARLALAGDDGRTACWGACIRTKEYPKAVPEFCYKNMTDGGCCMQNSSIEYRGNCTGCRPQGYRSMKTCRGCFAKNSPCEQMDLWRRDAPACNDAGCSGGCMVDGAKCSPYATARGCKTDTCNKMLNEQSCLGPDYGGTYCHTCDTTMMGACLTYHYCYYSGATGCCSTEDNDNPPYPYVFRMTGGCAGCKTASPKCDECWSQWPCSLDADKDNIMPWQNTNGWNHMSNLTTTTAAPTTTTVATTVAATTNAVTTVVATTNAATTVAATNIAATTAQASTSAASGGASGTTAGISTTASGSDGLETDAAVLPKFNNCMVALLFASLGQRFL